MLFFSFVMILWCHMIVLCCIVLYCVTSCHVASFCSMFMLRCNCCDFNKSHCYALCCIAPCCVTCFCVASCLCCLAIIPFLWQYIVFWFHFLVSLFWITATIIYFLLMRYIWLLLDTTTHRDPHRKKLPTKILKLST